MICRAAAATVLRDRNFFLSLITKAANLSQLNQTHAQLILNGLGNDLIAVTKLTQRFSDLNAIAHAKLIFNAFNCVSPPDLFLYNVVLRGFSQNNSPFDSLSMYLHLRGKTKLKPDNFTYAFVVSGVSSSGYEKFGGLLHGHAIVSGYGSDLFVGSALVDMYMNFERIGHACKVFDGITGPDTVVWNTMVSGLARNCCFDDAVRVFRNMVVSGTPFDSTTLSVVLTAVAELQALRLGMMVHCLAVKAGYHFHDYVITGLISAYSKCGDVKTAEMLFEHIRKPDLIAYNAMIAGFSCNNEIESSVRLFNKLLVSEQKVKSSTIVGLIPVYFPFGHLDLTCSIHGLCVKTGMITNPSVSTALTTVYSRLNEIESARQLFNESPEKSLASWNAMISGYTQNGLTEMAISLFLEMQKLDIHPNPVTITSILSACAQLGALSIGKWVHELINKENFESNIYVLTALVDMYAKCGSIDKARQLFDAMLEKNVVTWNAMISGYGLHGYGRESLMLFDKMLGSGVHPTGVTFLSLLYACSHTGLVVEGENVFYSMVHNHGIKPLSEHYACMVDLLGRAGKLEKALDFINKMPVEPGPAEWGALLAACMIHKDSNLAHLASEKLFELDTENVGYYVLLSNIYSADRNYPQAASVRQMVKKRKLAKIPGCTLIEVDGHPYVFKSSDQSHPQSSAIYAKLEELMEKMREAGFQAETSIALHDVEEEEKELMVKVHSEKLAISFGLITSEPGTEIRIIKNLRVCIDCHNFTKFISKITERVIVVRDANRFHHFKDGTCSCGDYW
ncbi:PREDICTED: pentatricopeptide repeat-containing protein At4g30700 isoform X1 [Ipomoea nil]|uniref:pentatricopeptide repeat-containing protein At4g30700 isoform X1 n=1 Tax=Ipomoea nil TaxID=35883 RepID=UPI00090186EE|nr:PREDICTED: pentatricopeptide repeat-containing protein At4g30700 isoform X1 [Ipomoea nil]XP_019177960.1 PREDICTED: pentatricopeptide repeat-containing protein At4g30700 isoform X1 [Ipomoea nil]XP_019177961.1 PREDICTED: pentatricopeptide repeat-containing protein At4g30700 isoform X1 [Ipomoea nil]XP_019177962.1 PREDICTED: pentatricopeptide repeat-containing protein At4g30700 isoform X1 [Ipomoea nil]